MDNNTKRYSTFWIRMRTVPGQKVHIRQQDAQGKGLQILSFDALRKAGLRQGRYITTLITKDNIFDSCGDGGSIR